LGAKSSYFARCFVFKHLDPFFLRRFSLRRLAASHPCLPEGPGFAAISASLQVFLEKGSYFYFF